MAFRTLLDQRTYSHSSNRVFAGNTSDINVFHYALKDVKERLPLQRVIIVADRGVITEDLLETSEAELKQCGLLTGLAKRKGYGRHLNVLEEGKAEIDWGTVLGKNAIMSRI